MLLLKRHDPRLAADRRARRRVLIGWVHKGE
jgi:hypothetical protein